jgi:DNA repair protein RecO (recombination protein O)
MSTLSYSDEIIILRVKNWQTADKYAVCFSRLHGRINFIAYGAKYPRSITGRLIQPFAVLNAEFYEGSSVDKLKNCEVLQRTETLTIDQMAYASLAAEVTELLTEARDAREEIYDLLLGTLGLLPKHNARLVVLAYLVKLLDLTGIGPVYERCVICGRDFGSDAVFSNEQGGVLCGACKTGTEGWPVTAEIQKLWRTLAQLDWASPAAFSVKGSALMGLERILHSYLVYQTERPLKSLDFIAQLK